MISLACYESYDGPTDTKFGSSVLTAISMDSYNCEIMPNKANSR